MYVVKAITEKIGKSIRSDPPRHCMGNDSRQGQPGVLLDVLDANGDLTRSL